VAIPNKKVAAAVALCAATAAWGWWALHADDEAALATAVSTTAPSADSLRGTEVDGNVRASASGELVLDQELLRLFDYYLATLGERDLKSVRTAVANALQRRLSGSALQSALDLFERYLQYKQAMDELEQQPLAKGGTLADKLAAIRALRQHFFSAQENQSLFGKSDSYDDFTLKRMQLMSNTSLSAEAKAKRLSELENQLPPELKAARQEPVKHIALAEAEAALRARGGGEQEVYALRARMAGQAAADRLAALDKEQAAWKARIESFQQARQQILNDASRTPEQRQAALAELAASRFNAQEQKRLAAYP